MTYVDVNGLPTWHEVHGQGPPVVLLHGATGRWWPCWRPSAAPTLVLQGDHDEVTLEHGAAVAATLPHGRLAVLPGTHALPVEAPEVVNALLIWFLAGATPAVDWTATAFDH